MLAISPKLGEFLIKTTQTPDVETALRQVLREYLELKLKELGKELEQFESKWNMSFDEFKEKCEQRKIDGDVFSYEVEKDFWNWEKAESLKKYHEELKSQWM